MRSLLFLSAAWAVFCLYSCTPPSGQGTNSMEQLPQLGEGNQRVAVQSVQVTGALTKADALTGLAQALPHLQQAVQAGAADGEVPKGTFAASFRTEPDGMIRMVLDGENRLIGPGAGDVVERFAASTMAGKWRFPQGSGPSLIQAEFVINVD
jgi:hypothetical protein